MTFVQYPDDWEPQDCILVTDALVRYARWDCEDGSDRYYRAIALADEVSAAEGLTLEDAIKQVE